MSINNNTRATKAPSTCHIYVSCKTPRTAPDLPLLLGCPVLYASRVGSQFSWKVKIHRHSLYDALRSAAVTHSVHVWRNNTQPKSPPPSPSNSATTTTENKNKTVTIASWNCRGLHNSKHYILNLIQNGADIIILQEHWLWPYELTTLSSLHPQYVFTAVSDKRLHSSSDLERGCGGIAINWNKALECMPISVLDSDRVCGVRLLLPTQKNHTQRCLTVLGVYMPSSEHSQETYSSYLDTVEYAISQFTADGPLLLMGDLNAHLGS